MSGGLREAKLNSLLAQCKQLFDRLLQIIPDLRSPSVDSMPYEQKRLAATTGLYLLRALEEVEGLLRAATLEGAPQGIAPTSC